MKQKWNGNCTGVKLWGRGWGGPALFWCWVPQLPIICWCCVQPLFFPPPPTRFCATKRLSRDDKMEFQEMVWLVGTLFSYCFIHFVSLTSHTCSESEFVLSSCLQLCCLQPIRPFPLLLQTNHNASPHCCNKSEIAWCRQPIRVLLLNSATN